MYFSLFIVVSRALNTFVESHVTYRRDAIGNGYGGQALTTRKSLTVNVCDNPLCVIVSNSCWDIDVTDVRRTVCNGRCHRVSVHLVVDVLNEYNIIFGQCHDVAKATPRLNTIIIVDINVPSWYMKGDIFQLYIIKSTKMGINMSMTIHIFQATTAPKCSIVNLCYAIGNGHRFQSCAAKENSTVDISDAVWDDDRCQAATAIEGTGANGCDNVRDVHRGQTTLSIKSTFTDGDNAIGDDGIGTTCYQNVGRGFNDSITILTRIIDGIVFVNHYGGQILTAQGNHLTDGGDTVRDGYGSQIMAIHKSIITD